MSRGDPATFLHLLSVAAIPGLFAITLHEVAHGWAARWFGDRSAEFLGRLSLNPLRHVDPVGTVLLPLMTLWMGGLVFGWAKPVPVNARALRNPHRNMVAIAAAGPLANLGMAVAWALLLRLVGGVGSVAGEWMADMASFGIYFNALLAVFNLLPVPPLDGGRVLRGLLPRRLALRMDAIEPYGLILVVALLFTGVLGRFMGPVLDAVTSVVLALAGVRG
jgi:Zn-dependent protease